MWPRKFITQNIQDGHVYEQGGGGGCRSTHCSLQDRTLFHVYVTLRSSGEFGNS